VMGDCRGDSSDSRVWGTVPASNIIGKVTVVVWRHNHPWVHWF
jgi:signal peptidase I